MASAPSGVSPWWRHEMQERRRRTGRRWQNRASQRRARSRDGVEHRLDVGGRARDHAQDLAGRGLLLEGLGEVAVARLELLEQPHVLDGDDRLVGEGLAAARSAGRGSARRSARPTVIAPIGTPSRSMRHRQHAAVADGLSDRACAIVGVREHVGDRGRSRASSDRPARRAVRGRRPRDRRVRMAAIALGGQPWWAAKWSSVAVEPEDDGRTPPRRAGAALCGDRVEDRLDVGRRAARSRAGSRWWRSAARASR